MDASMMELELTSDYENAISQVGYGLFHYWLLLICGLGNANEAIAIICISFLLPAAECELKLTTPQKGWLTIIMFVGMMFGGYFGGAISDLYGRRNILVWCLLFNGFFIIIMSLSTTYHFLLAAILFVGIGLGSSVPIIWAYFTEFQPKAMRGTALCYLSSFWMIGNISVSILGRIIIPDSSSIKDLHSRWSLQGWRLFVALCSIPSFVVAFALLFLPKSPKFLMMEKKNGQALRVLKIIHSTNCGTKNKPFTLDLSNTESSTEPEMKKSVYYAMILMSRNTSRLLHFPFRNVFCAIVLIVFSLCFGYYGLWMWLPEIFKRMEHNLSNDVGICDLPSPSPITSFSKDDCTHSLDSEIFTEEIFVALFNIPGHLIAILFMDKVGRRLFLMTGMIFSGLSVFAVWLVTTKWSCLLLSSLFGMLTTLSHSALGVLGMEVFPTDLRGTACGVSQIAARLGAILGNLVFGQLVDSRCSVPVLMVATFLVLGGLFSQVMPDLTRMPLL
uniref:Major facilitator superfamily (MFS) profile domain-containing protein n=1 Tax=Strigamia maritima TaxID=126957 RepID=T1IKY4_STRMM